jgi:hypothetical protein
MKLNGKVVNLGQLQAEMQAAGVVITKGLERLGDDLNTYTATGVIAPLQGAQAQAVLDVHVPVPPTDYGTDAPPRDQVAAAVANIRQYLALSAPTNPQVIAEVRLLSRCVLYLLQQIAV